MCNQGGPGKSARSSLCSHVKCVTILEEEYPSLLEKVSFIPDSILCEVYVVMGREGMVQNSLCCHTIPNTLLGLRNCVPFNVLVYLQYCMLEDSSTKCETCDIYICVRGACGENLVGRTQVGTKISMTLFQPMKKLNFIN